MKTLLTIILTVAALVLFAESVSVYSAMKSSIHQIYAIILVLTGITSLGFAGVIGFMGK